MNSIVYSSLETRLLRDWLILWNRCAEANYANGPQWFQSIVESFGLTDYRIIAVYEREQLVAITALVKEKKFGISVYSAFPQDYICVNPFLIERKNTKAMGVLIRAVQGIGTSVLPNIPESVLQEVRTKKINFVSAEYSINFSLALGPNEASYLPAPIRKKLMHRVHGNETDFSVQDFTGNDSQALDLAFEIDNQSRKKTKGYNTFSHSDVKTFFHSLAKNFKEHLRVHILYFQKIPIAYEIGFAVGDEYVGSQIGFHEGYARHAPGKVMVVLLLEKLSKQGIQKMNFGSGDSPLKRSLTDTYQTLHMLILSNTSWVMLYMKIIFELKAKTFEWMKKHQKIYIVYRKLRNVIQS